MAAEVVASATMASSALAFGFSSNHPFLAAGSAPGAPNPGVAFYRATACSTGVDLLEFVGRVPSPAACCRLSWSRPTEATCSSAMLPTGLLAAGLVNGSVAVWDPRNVLGYSESASTRVIEGYFLPNKSLPVDRSTCNLAVEGDAASESESEWISQPDIVEDYFTLATTADQKRTSSSVSGPSTRSTDEHGTWFLPFSMIENYFDGSAPSAAARTSEDMVTLLSSHSMPVKGLAFSPITPNFLASAAEENIMLWDLVNCHEQKIPSLQLTEAESVKIAYLAWSSVNPNTVTSASNAGIAVWDITMEKPLVRKLSLDQSYSIVEWSPTDNNIIIAASGADYDVTTMKVWDMRKMDPPMYELRGDMKGIIALDWSPFHKDIVLACTGSKKVLIVNVKKGQVLLEDESPDTCLDIQWSKQDADIFALSTSEKIKLCRKAQE